MFQFPWVGGNRGNMEAEILREPWEDLEVPQDTANVGKGGVRRNFKR